jgi:lysozyme
MTENEIKKMIQRHEGYRPYIYYDSLGYPTGGYGHAFLDRSPLSHDVAVLLFEDDFNQAKKDYEKLGLDLDSVRKAVIIDMLFNLGLIRFRSFVKMIDALKAEDYLLAAKEMIASRWAEQTKSRALELAAMMRNGES